MVRMDFIRNVNSDQTFIKINSEKLDSLTARHLSKFEQMCR